MGGGEFNLIISYLSKVLEPPGSFQTTSQYLDRVLDFVKEKDWVLSNINYSMQKYKS